MRPPQNAGEDPQADFIGFQGVCGFNEAPAERGGRHARLPAMSVGIRRASMRPPQNAGEDDGVRTSRQ